MSAQSCGTRTDHTCTASSMHTQTETSARDEPRVTGDDSCATFLQPSRPIKWRSNAPQVTLCKSSMKQEGRKD
eukprot:3016373-Pleurochrysis_carterae.AAC.2